MDILEEIFGKGKYNIPIIFKDDDFKSELDKLLISYINDLRSKGIRDSTVSKIDKFRELCGSSLSKYLKGTHSEAYDDFKVALNALKISDSPLLKSFIPIEMMYRARENRDDIDSNDYSKDKMFHIPLNERRKVSTQRYSFPGTPCLYLGASVYTCWLELNSPIFERFQVAAIMPTPNAEGKEIYDLSHIPQKIYRLKKNEWFNPEEYLLYWPLLALCSIKVNHETYNFKPEYIFPQFLLESILRGTVDGEPVGIKYVSIKASSICAKQLLEDWHTYVNYVFPSKSDSMCDSYCDLLKRTFEIQSNHSGRELTVLTRIFEIEKIKAKLSNKHIVGNDTNNTRRYLFSKDGKRYPYNLSVFGAIEDVMLYGDNDIEELEFNLMGIVKNVIKTSKDNRDFERNVDYNKENVNDDNTGNGWDNSSGQWQWLLKGAPIKDAWKPANGTWFYLGNDGNLVRNSLVENEDGTCWYVDKYGAMVTESWKAIAADEDIRAEYVWMYFGKDGKAYRSKDKGRFELKNINDKTYAFNEKGIMLYGWIKKDSSKLRDDDLYAWESAEYYFGDWNDGAMTVGKKKIMVMDKDGKYHTYEFIFDNKGIKRACQEVI